MSESYDKVRLLIEKTEIEKGCIYLWGDVDESLAEYVIERLRYIHYVLKKKEVYLYIHSDGGETDSCCAIIDEIIGLQSLGVKVYTIAIGKAYSSAAMILSVGSERYATPLTSLMLHPVSFDCPTDYVSQQSKYTTYIERHWDNVAGFIAKKCGYKNKGEVAKFRIDIKDGLWMTTDEAIDFGLIDGVWDYEWEQHRNEED